MRSQKFNGIYLHMEFFGIFLAFAAGGTIVVWDLSFHGMEESEWHMPMVLWNLKIAKTFSCLLLKTINNLNVPDFFLDAFLGHLSSKVK